ncbi:MAG: rod shape-determining protein MreC [Desulfobacteraceae bacterium IS3]|nr:MAG: rod shape-determining protein MreC [Desulfobacteraceae bacterium IS3]
MFSKRNLTVAGIIVMVVISIAGLSVSGRRGYAFYGSGIAMVFAAPFHEMTSLSLRFARDIWKHYFYLVSVSETNDALIKSLNDALEKSNRCKEIELSNFRLRSLLNFRRTVDVRVLAAEVISKDPSPWFKSIVIDKGKADGLAKGMPVVVPQGIVGLIADVSYRYSTVLLIVDQNSAVDSLIQRTRARGILKGDGTACLFKYVLRKHDIKEGDTVISSGLDGVFPKGLVLGRVMEIIRSNSGIFQEVSVIPSVDFENLEELLVVVNVPRYTEKYDPVVSSQ